MRVLTDCLVKVIMTGTTAPLANLVMVVCLRGVDLSVLVHALAFVCTCFLPTAHETINCPSPESRV